VPAEEVIPARLVIFCSMAALFVASLAVPGAFGEYGVIFGSAYFVVQLLHLLLYSLATGRDPEVLEDLALLLRLRPRWAPEKRSTLLGSANFARFDSQLIGESRLIVMGVEKLC
jgi:hypothetical protein